MTQAQEPKPRKGWLNRLAAITDMFAFPLRTSHYVELVNPLWTTHRMHARVVDVWDETKDCRTITLQPGANWRLHRPGHPGILRRRGRAWKRRGLAVAVFRRV